VQNILLTTGSKAFGKERRYIWEPRKTPLIASDIKSFQKSLEDEKTITRYYFAHTRNQLYFLLITGLVFFSWVFYNYNSIKSLDKLSALEEHHLQYLTRFPLIGTLILVLNLAPLFDLNAPAIYVECIELLLMFVIGLQLLKVKPKSLFVVWLLFAILFGLITFTRLFGIPYYVQRWWTLSLNSFSFLMGLFAMIWYRKRIKNNKIIFFAGLLFILVNLLSVLCNMYGRVTISQILGTTGFYVLAETVGLIIFVQLFREALLLQIQGSRMRKNYPISFDFSAIGNGIATKATYLAIFIWLVVLTTNLNIYSPIEKIITDFLLKPRTVGNFSIRLSGVLLFLVIIWVANFLQKYIGYFFGDVGDEASFDNKGQRSKLMITRLILLTAGFLLAIAASGLALNQITIILGALGVGIGLGLQNIVNNFVSGIILIFDRPLRIGDMVEIGDQKGRVREISVRSSTLLTADGAEVIIPNGDILSKNIVNWTFSNSHARIKVSFAIDKSSLSDELLNMIRDVISQNADVLVTKEPEILIDTINANDTELNIYFWCKDVIKAGRTRSNIYSEIYKHLDAKGIKVQ
jgi:small-conductance mechanosensitive channel